VTSVHEGISPTNILMGSVPRSEQGQKSPVTRKSREWCIVGGLIRYIFESRRMTARGAREERVSVEGLCRGSDRMQSGVG
jgi:hypothetical protein